MVYIDMMKTFQMAYVRQFRSKKTTVMENGTYII